MSNQELQSTEVETPTVTSPEEWKQSVQRGFILTLPSGNRVRVRRTMDFMAMIRKGVVPNPLAGMVKEMIDGKRQKISGEDLDEEKLAAFMQMVDEVVSKTVIEPKVQIPPEFTQMEDDELKEWCEKLNIEWRTSEKGKALMVTELGNEWEPREGYISIDMIDMEDKMFIFSVAQGGTTDIETFRLQQREAMGAIPDVQGVPEQAKSPAGNPG